MICKDCGMSNMRDGCSHPACPHRPQPKGAGPMTEIDRESVERLASTCERRGYVSPPRAPSDYSASFTCQEALDMAKCIRSLLARLAEVEVERDRLREEIADMKDGMTITYLMGVDDGRKKANEAHLLAALTEKGTTDDR